MSNPAASVIHHLSLLERERCQIMQAIAAGTVTAAQRRAPLTPAVISLWQDLGRVNDEIDEVLHSVATFEALPGAPLPGSMGLM